MSKIKNIFVVLTRVLNLCVCKFFHKALIQAGTRKWEIEHFITKHLSQIFVNFY